MSRGSVCKLNISLPEGARVIGIDQSLTATGLAILIGDSLTTATLSPPSPTKECPSGGACRLVWFRDRIGSVLRANRPTIVVMEGYSFGSKSHAHSLGELGGVIRVLFFESGVEHAIVVPPGTLKKFATGNGAADKSLISKELFRKWGVDVSNNNEADAAALALIGAALHFPDVFHLSAAAVGVIYRACEYLALKK